MTTPDTSSYLGRALASDEDRPKLPWLKFADEGDAVTLTITDKGMAPDYEYTKVKDAPRVQKTWPDGKLKEFMVITGTLDQPARVGDGTTAGATAETGTAVNLAIKGKLMTQALARAVVTEASKADVEPGGKLWIKFTGWTVSKNGYEAKAFTAKYQPPAADTSGFLSGGLEAGSGLRAPAGKAPAQDSAPPF